MDSYTSKQAKYATGLIIVIPIMGTIQYYIDTKSKNETLKYFTDYFVDAFSGLYLLLIAAIIGQIMLHRFAQSRENRERRLNALNEIGISLTKNTAALGTHWDMILHGQVDLERIRHWFQELMNKIQSISTTNTMLTLNLNNDIQNCKDKIINVIGCIPEGPLRRSDSIDPESHNRLLVRIMPLEQELLNLHSMIAEKYRDIENGEN